MRNAIKDLLAFLGLMFLTLMVFCVVVFIGLFYDSLGMIKIPDQILQIPATLTAMNEVRIEVQGPGGGGEWSNPLNDLSDPTMPVFAATPEPRALPAPTITPVPPLDPGVYQVETVERLKLFADALQRWLNNNQIVSSDPTRMQDPAWQEEMRASLAEVEASGKALAAVGPAPREYSGIDALLDRTAQEAEGLAWNYTRGLDSGDAESLKAAGENFSRLKGFLQQAVEQMVANGWIIR